MGDSSLVENLQLEFRRLRSYLESQEKKIEDLVAQTCKSSNTAESSDKVNELLELLNRSKVAAREADGRIKLLQYQLSKVKAAKQSSSNRKAVSFAENKENAQEINYKVEDATDSDNYYRLLHWMRFRDICTSISNFTFKEKPKDNERISDSINMVHSNESDVVQTSCLQELIEDFGVLNQSFLNVSRTSASRSRGKPLETFMPEALHQKIFNTSPSSSLSGISSTCSTASTVTTKFDHTAMMTSFKMDNYGHGDSREESKSLRSYLALKKGCSKSFNSMSTSEPPTDSGKRSTNMSHNDSLISPAQMKLIFKGFHQEVEPTISASNTIVSTPQIQPSSTPCFTSGSAHSEISSLGKSRMSFASSRRGCSSTHSSSMKTISRLIDCGSFVTEGTGEELSCHTLSTEFDLIHNLHNYNMLRAKFINIEQPAMGH